MRKTSFGETKKGNFLDKLFLNARIKQVTKEISNLNKDSIVADLGCGYKADFLLELINTFPNISMATGVDLSVYKTSPNEKIRLIEGDLNNHLSLADNSFDLVFSTAVLEHLENYRLAVQEIYRILKKGGVLCLTTPSPMAKPVLEFLAYKLKIIYEHEIRDHKNYFSKDDLEKLFKEVGFNDVRVRTFQFGFNNFAQGTK